MSQSQEGTVLPATPGATLAARAPRMWVGAVLLAAGLGLVVLGGCFLIGIWIMIGAHGVQEQTGLEWSRAAQVLLGVLYTLAGLCVLGAVILFIFGVRSLLSLLKA